MFFLCQDCEETMDHLLLHCIKTRALWGLLFSFFSLLGEPCLSLGNLVELEWVFCWQEMKKSGGGPLCIFWLVWMARNTIIFRDDVLSLQKVK